MKNLKIFLLINLIVLSTGTVQSLVTIREATEAFVKDHAESIAGKLLRKKAENEYATWNDILSVLNDNEMRSYIKISESGFGAITGMKDDEQFIVGAVQAALDNAHLLSVGFEKAEKIVMDSDIRLYEEAAKQWRPWIQKNSNKIVRYLNENDIDKVSDFEEIAKACKAQKIALQDSLHGMVKEYLIDEINAMLDILNPSISFAYKQNFDKREDDYIRNYLILKLFAKGYISVSADQLEKFLEDLPNKSHTGIAIEKKIGKFDKNLKKSFAIWISEQLKQQKSLEKMLDLLKTVQKQYPADNKEYLEAFSAAEKDYFMTVVIPKLSATGATSMTIDQFEKFLKTLPDSIKNRSAEGTFDKLSPDQKQRFINLMFRIVKKYDDYFSPLKKKLVKILELLKVATPKEIKQKRAERKSRASRKADDSDLGLSKLFNQ